MSFFQYSNDSRHQNSITLSQSTSQYKTSYIEDAQQKQQNSKDERIRNIKSKLSSIPSSSNKQEDNLNIFNLQQSSLTTQSYISQNQNINNINLLSNSLYSNKPNQNSYLQQHTQQQKSYLGNQVNMERKTRMQIRGSIRNEYEDDSSLTNIREKNALFFDEDENRRRSFTPSQSSSNESFYKQQQSQNQQITQKGGGFFGNKLQEIKLRRFQIDAAKLIIDRLVKISYKSFNDIYEYSQQRASSNRNNSTNKNGKQQKDPYQNIFSNHSNEDIDQRKYSKLSNNKNQIKPSSSSSTLLRKLEQDICLSDRKQRQNFQNNNFNLQTLPSDSSFSQSQSKLSNYSQIENHKISNRKLSIQIPSSTIQKQFYRHISPCERQQPSSQISRSRNISSIITNNSLNNNQNSSYNFSLSQNNNFSNSPNGLYNTSIQQSHQNHLQYFQQLSNGNNNNDLNLRRASSQENKLVLNDNSFDNGLGREKSQEKIHFINGNKNNSLERNSSSYSVMLHQIRQSNNQNNFQQQQQHTLNNNEGNSNLNFYQKQSNNQQSNLTERLSRNNNILNTDNQNNLKDSPQRKSAGGYIQNNISVPKSFLDPHQKRLQRQSYSSQHLNSYFQTSFFKQGNEESQSSQYYQQHNIHQQQPNNLLSLDKQFENCLTDQSFVRMSTSGSRNGLNGGDLLSVRLNSNESNNQATLYPPNRGSLKENDLMNEQVLSRSYQKIANSQLKKEIENRRSFNNQKQDSLDAIFDDNGINRKGGSLIEYEEENDMKVSNIQKLKQEFNQIIKFSFQNEIRQPSVKGDEQQKIVSQNRVSEKINTSNDDHVEQNSHNIYNQNLNNSNSNIQSQPQQLQQQQQKGSGVYNNNPQKQKLQDQFQSQLQKQQQQGIAQRGQDEKNCISARNNTSAFIVESLLNQEEVKSFSCYDEDLIKQQDLTIHQLSTKNQNLNTEFSNFKDELIFDKTVHSFDFNMSLRESENNLRQKINFQQEQALSPNGLEKQIIQGNQQNQQSQQLPTQQKKVEQHIQIINQQQEQQNNIPDRKQQQNQQIKRENVQFNGSFGRLSVDSTPRNNEDTSQSEQSKRPLSHFARQQSEEDNDLSINEVILTETQEEGDKQEDIVKRAQNNNNKKYQIEQNFGNKFSQLQNDQEGEGEEIDNESSRFSFELKNTLDEFQTQQHLEQIMFNQNNQTTNEDISIIEKNNKSNFSIFIDKNDRNNISIFNSNNEELQNIVTSSQINFNPQQNFQNTQSDNILIAQTFPVCYSNTKNNEYTDVSFDQNQNYNENVKKQYEEHTKKYNQEDTQQYFGETKKQLFADNKYLTVSSDGNEEVNNANLNALHNIITGNSNQLQSNQIDSQQQSLFQPVISQNEQDQQLFQQNPVDPEQLLYQANVNEFTPPRRKMINPVNHYPMAIHAESSPIIDQEIAEGGQGLKIYEFTLKLQGIMRSVETKNIRESFISILIYSQLKTYLMSACQSQWLQQQQNELLQAHRAAQIQNIPYYYQSQFSTIYEQQNETCSDIYLPHSMNASKLLDSRSLYDSKNLEQINLEMNRITIFNSLQFVQNQLQIASQQVTQSSILESNINSSQNTSYQPQNNPLGATQSEVVTEIDSNDNGIKQFWALRNLHSFQKIKLQQVVNLWRENSQELIQKQEINQGKQFIQNNINNKPQNLLNVIKSPIEQIILGCIKLQQILMKQQYKDVQKVFQKLILNFNNFKERKQRKIEEQQLRYHLHSMIQIISNYQQDSIRYSLKEIKRQTIDKTKLIQVLDNKFKKNSYKLFLDKIRSIYELKKRRELSLQPLLFNARRYQNQLFSKYLERWRMHLYQQSTHFNKYSALSNLSNTIKSKSSTNIQIAFKKLQLKSLQYVNRQKFLKNLLLQILLFVENKKQELKFQGFQQLFQNQQFKNQRELKLQNLIKSRILKEQHKYFNLFCKRVNDYKNHEQFIKTGIKSLLLMGTIIQSKINQKLLSAFKIIQFQSLTKRRVSASSNPTIDLLNNEHETIKLTLKSLRNNLQKVKIESLIKGFSHIQQKFQQNQTKYALGKLQDNCKHKLKIVNGVVKLQQIHQRILKQDTKICFNKLKSLISERLQLKKNIQSQKQLFYIFLKTLFSKKLQNLKSTGFQSIKERSHQILKAKRDKKLIYTESSMFAVKCKLLFGTLDKVFKRHLYQYPFLLIYGCQQQKYTTALQFYQTLTNQNQKNSIQQQKKTKTQVQQIQNQKNLHASSLLHLSKSKSPLKKIQEQHQAKCEIIKTLVNKNEDSKQITQTNSNNNKKDTTINQKYKTNQTNIKTLSNQTYNSNETDKNKPKTSQSQIIPTQQRQSPNQSTNSNQYNSQIICSSSQTQIETKKDELSLSSKSKCITFGGNSNSPQQKNEINNKSNTSIHNISSVTNFCTNSSPKNSERIFTSQKVITSPQTNNYSSLIENQKQQQQQQVYNNNTNNLKLPYFQHSRNYSSGNVPSSISQPLINSSSSSSSIIFYSPSNNSIHQFN